MMKKLLLFGFMVLLVTACKKDNLSDFSEDPPLEIYSLHGKWLITHVEQADGSYLDVTSPSGREIFETTYITFNNDRTFSTSGYFGIRSGSFRIENTTIVTYISDVEFLKFEIDVFGNLAQMEIFNTEGKALKVKCKK